MDSGSEDNFSRWKGRQQERPELRRPFCVNSGNTDESKPDHSDPDVKPNVLAESGDILSRGGLSSAVDSTRNIDSGQSKSCTLSPFAKEFIPQNFQQPTGSVLSPFAKEFTPSNQANECSFEESEMVGDTHSLCIDVVGHFIGEVTVNPASFDKHIEAIVDILRTNGIDDEVLKSVAELIIHNGIHEPNFRYSAGRMSMHFCESFQENNFRNLVLKVCQDMFNKMDELLLDPDMHATCRGFTIFLGELFSQLRIRGNRLVILGKIIPLLLEKLLSYPTSDNLKCVCQVIKFVGAHIDDQERATKSGQAPTMDKIISRINEYAKEDDDSIDRSVRGMLTSVLNLHAANYGRGDVSPPIVTNNSIPENISEPIRYGPDGQQLTQEEASFMDSVYDEVPNGEDYGNDEEPCNSENEEMDDEMHTAFEEFLRDIPQNNNVPH